MGVGGGDGRQPSNEQLLAADPRWQEAVALFNAAEWYAAHDELEALWHESVDPLRALLQGILQIAVAQLHRERGNHRGAVILMGEGLGRLRRCNDTALGIDIDALRHAAAAHLQELQSEADWRPQECAGRAALPPLILKPRLASEL
jgi:predicted metal-dependent hydrolase